MSNLQSFIPIINGAITDIQQAQGLDSAGRKALAGSVITKLVAASSLSADEQALINMVAPLLINDLDTIKKEAIVVEKDVKGCFSKMFSRNSKK